jgi:hypothetical protein
MLMPAGEWIWARAVPTGQEALRRGRSIVSTIFGADLRSLALFRIVIAAIALYDLIVRFGNIRAHYSDAGVLPRELLLDSRQLTEWRWSLFLVNGTELFQAAVFGIGVLAAMAMLVGFRTRLATIVLWSVVLSIHVRNPYLNSGGDNLLRLMLFWSMFLPLGARWSRDAARQPTRARRPKHHVSFATAAVFLQIAIMYWMTAYLKSGDAWHGDRTALHYALGLGHYVRPFGEYLWQYPGILSTLTFATIWLEWLGPVLLFSPLFNGPVRTAAAAALMSLHVGIWMTLDIGIFPWISAMSMVCFLPTWFWDTLVPRVVRVIQQLTAERIRLLPRTVQVGPARLVAGGDHRRPSTASPASFGIEAPSKRARDWRRVATEGAVALCLLYVVLLNVRTVTGTQIPASIRPIEQVLHLRQQWAMFAPAPSRAAVWYVMPGTLANGDRVDVLPALVNNDMTLLTALSFNPEYLAFENKQWRQFLGSLRNDATVVRRQALARYACREWNAAHSGEWQLASVQYGVVREPTLETSEHGAPREALSDPLRCS